MIAMPCVIVMIQIVSNTNIINEYIGNTALNCFKSLYIATRYGERRKAEKKTVALVKKYRN